MQEFNIGTNQKVEADFNFPGFSATKIIMWNFIWMNPLKSGMI